MPPRLCLLRNPKLLVPSFTTSTQPSAAFLAPFLLSQSSTKASKSQARHASILSNISDVPSAYNKRIRVGRGPASGKGKTSGRGHKGQKQHGKVPAKFNGGQTPDHVVNPIRGVDNKVKTHFAVKLVKVNVDRIQEWIDQGRLNPNEPITIKHLQNSRCTHGLKDGVKLLARNKEALRTPINIIVSRASAGAIEAIEAVGGTITTRYYTRPSIKRILAKETDPIHSLMSNFPHSPYSTTSSAAPTKLPPRKYPYRLPDATSRRDMEYYRDPAHRGYLSYLVGQNEGPSLFFKAPKVEGAKVDVKKKAAAAKKAENRLW